MYHDVSHLLSRLINGPLPLRQIYFASASGPAPELAYGGFSAAGDCAGGRAY